MAQPARHDDEEVRTPAVLSVEARAKLIADEAMSIRIPVSKRRAHIEQFALEQIRNAVAMAVNAGGRR